MIGMDGVRESGNCVLSVRLDDDVDDDGGGGGGELIHGILFVSELRQFAIQAIRSVPVANKERKLC